RQATDSRNHERYRASRVAGFSRVHGVAETFDQILSKQEGTCGSLRGLQWISHFGQLRGTTENLRGDARLPVGWNRPHNAKGAGSNPAPATKNSRPHRHSACGACALSRSDSDPNSA